VPGRRRYRGAEAHRRQPSKAATPIGPSRWTSQRRSAEGWSAFTTGRREEGLTTLHEAAEREGRTEKAPITPGPLAPARELLAEALLEALLEAAQHAAALREFEAVLRNEPRRFRASYGAGRAAEPDAARRAYGQLLEIGRRPTRSGRAGPSACLCRASVRRLARRTRRVEPGWRPVSADAPACGRAGAPAPPR
jgi:hypothetical protein